MPKISVLMPVYNTKEEYLREAIESILNQTYTDFEFIILDDNSTESKTINTLNLYKERDARIRVIQGAHVGIAAARNTLVKESVGEYFCWMDSDDISFNNRLAIQAKFLDSNKDIDVCGSYYQCIPNGNIVKLKSRPKYLDFIKYMQMGNPTMMFRRETFEKYNFTFDNSFVTSEDYELYSRMIKCCKFVNIPEVLLKYRILPNSLCHSTQHVGNINDKLIRNSMLDYLTDNKELQRKILNLIEPRYSFWQNLFSIKPEYESDCKHLIITFLGLKLKIKQVAPVNIVALKGGLGNQMFQYAFGKALEYETGQKTLYDISWFKKAQKRVVNDKGENAQGVVMRKYVMDIFQRDIPFATEKQIKMCKKKIYEQKEFEYDANLLKKQKNVIYEGYFQNEGYLKNIRNITKDFKFPEIDKNDEFNQNWIRKIRSCENPVFLHLRRGDYLNINGWALSVDYYKKAIEYMKQHIENPTFFVFGQDCEEYINKEFNLDLSYEFIGENNSKNHEDWKDIVLMEECKHAIIANSSFSWWAAWLGNANKGIVVAPTPFLNGKDSIICENWVKIER